VTPVHRLGGALALAALAGCATVAPVSPPIAVEIESAFDVSGRLSARHGSDGVTVNFTWAHAPGEDRFEVATPLGQIVARLSGDERGVRVERPGEATREFADWSALTRNVFGVAIPVDGLAAWIQGVPVANAGFDLEHDASGRALVLRQQGWYIVYAYPDDSVSARPLRLVMRYPDSEPIEVRIVVDSFAAGGKQGEGDWSDR
jgi:outer membrane lipoprotein LolB